MISLQESSSPRGSSKAIQHNLHTLSHKRKWNHDDGSLDQSQEICGKRFRSPETTKSVSSIELQLETPLPLEWQRCLDIQSGKIDFYNTRTQKRTSMDPRRTSSQEAMENNNNMSLELELNLPCDSQRNKNKPSLLSLKSNKENIKKNNLQEEEEEEMVAIVCERCHLLVMLCKSSPSCPNCKFMHSIQPNFPNHINQLTRLPSCATYL